jgi:MFS family permease
VNPDSLQLQIIRFFQIDFFNFSVLQAMVSLPCVVVCIFAGFFLDIFGLSHAGLVFTCLTILGSTIFALSTTFESFNMALVGRAIYGVGCECQLVWFNCLTSVWFYYSEGAFSAGMGQTIGRLGGFLAGVMTPIIY